MPEEQQSPLITSSLMEQLRLYNTDPAILRNIASVLTEAFSLPERLPVSWSELAAVVLSVIAYDRFVYQGVYNVGNSFELNLQFGAAGLAVFCFLYPFLSWLGSRSIKPSSIRLITTVLVWGVGAKIVYSGVAPLDTFLSGQSPISGETAAGCGFLLAIALGLIGCGVPFSLGQWLRYGFSMLQCFIARPRDYLRFLTCNSSGFLRAGIASFLIPFAAVVLFAAIFMQANPELQKLWTDLWIVLSNWTAWLPDCQRVFIWIVLFACFSALLAWRNFDPLIAEMVEAEANPENLSERLYVPSGWLEIGRNTLIALALLFAGNLTLEYWTNFQYNWPAGFDFGTYCHQGAAWLTFALFLATIVLGLIFSPSVYQDSRIGSLKFWALLWTAENFLLAIAIYHRLTIYIGQTGLTSLRIVGLFGTTAVVGGLFWIAIRALKHRTWAWLIQRYIATAGFIIILYCILPVDAIVCRYNTRLMLTGNYAPAIHFAAQSISTEGWLQVFPLLNCSNETVRRGGAVLLSRELDRIIDKNQKRSKQQKNDWRNYCYTESEFLKQAEAYAPILVKAQGNWLDDYESAAETWYR